MRLSRFLLLLSIFSLFSGSARAQQASGGVIVSVAPVPTNPSGSITINHAPYVPTAVSMATTNSIAIGATLTGNFTIVGINADSRSTFTGITGDNVGNSYALDGTRTTGGGIAQLWHCSAPCNSGATTINTAATNPVGSMAIIVVDASGADPTTPVDVAAVSSGETSTTNPVGPSVTPSATNGLVVSFISPFTFTTALSSPFTYVPSSFGSALGYVSNSSAGTTYTPSWTTTLGLWAGVSVAYKPSSSSGPTNAVTSVIASCPSGILNTGATETCTAQVFGTGTFSQSVTWSVTGAGCSINSSGVLTAPGSAGTCAVKATSVTNPNISSSSVNVTITSTSTITSVTVTCVSASIQVNQTDQCSAAVAGTGSFSSVVTWNTTLGVISSTGLLTAPAGTGTASVTATSVQKSAVVSPAFTVTITAATAGTVPIGTFGSVGHGGDDTSVFQTGINTTAAAAQTLEITVGTYNIGSTSTGLSIPNNANILIDAGVTINGGTPGAGYNLFQISSSNVTITGPGGSVNPSPSTAVIQWPKSTLGAIIHNCFDVRGATNVTITGIAANQCGEDGVYIRQSTTVTVSNSVFSGEFRNGLSITGQVNHIFISGNQFVNNTNLAGGIADGVDVEPNVPGDFVEDVHFTNNTFAHNALTGLCFCLGFLDNTSASVSVVLSGNHYNDNGTAHSTSLGGSYGVMLRNADSGQPAGSIVSTGDFADSNPYEAVFGASWRDGGLTASFINLTITNSNLIGGDPKYSGINGAVGARVDGCSGSCNPMGNISFTGTNVSSSSGNMQYYFNFNNGGTFPGTGIVFDALGTLSGKFGTSNGLYNGVAEAHVP